MTLQPERFEPGQAFKWSRRERCELIVAEWVKRGSTSKTRIYPARENEWCAQFDPPEWACVIESRS